VRNGAGLRDDIDCGRAPIYLRATGGSAATADGKPERDNRCDHDGELRAAKAAWQTPAAPHREAEQRHGREHGERSKQLRNQESKMRSIGRRGDGSGRCSRLHWRGVTAAGLKLQVTPATGVQENETLFANPPEGTTFNVN